jgi:uncharacterized protein YceK
MKVVLVVLVVFVALVLGGCAAQTYVISTQIPGNSTLMNENECVLQGNASVCGPHMNILESSS